MKKLLLFGLVLSLTALSSQFTIAEIKSAPSDTTQSVNIKTYSWLGVWIEKLPVSLSKHLSSIVKDNQGLIIRKIAPDSPADKAGLTSYDIITKINDKEIFTEQQLVNIIHKTKPGTKVKLEIIRQGKILTMEAITEVSPNQAMASRQIPPQPFPPQDWINEPFLKYNFNQQFNHMQQQLEQLQQHQKQLYLNQQQQLQQQNGWSQFESIQIETIGNLQRAIVKYDDSKGNKKEFIFEGDQNEIRQQINAQDEMDNDKKQSLLQALDMKSTPPINFNQPFPIPHWFQH